MKPKNQKSQKPCSIPIRDIPYSQKKGKILYNYPHHREKHELEFAELLIRLGLDIVFIKPSIIVGASTPDCEWHDKRWEIKTIFEDNLDRVARSLKNAFGQSENVIIDISPCKIRIEDAANEIMKYIYGPRNRHGIMKHEIMIFDGNRYCIINKKVLKSK